MFPGRETGDVHGVRAVQPEFRYGETYTYAFTLHNSSRWKVEVLNFPADLQSGVMLERTGVRLGPPPGKLQDRFPSGKPEDAMAFRPFTLGPGHYRVILVDSRFTNCGASGAGMAQSFSTIRVRYRVHHYLLRTVRTADLSHGHEIEVVAPGPPGSGTGLRDGCPELRFNGSSGVFDGTYVHLDMNARLWLPEPRLWLTNEEPFEWRDCRITLQTSGGKFTNSGATVAAKGAVFRDPAAFVRADGRTWDPEQATPSGIALRCMTEHGVGITSRPTIE